MVSPFERSHSLRWQDPVLPKASEVCVEGEHVLDLELVHQHKGRAIRQRERVVSMPSKQPPRGIFRIAVDATEGWKDGRLWVGEWGNRSIAMCTETARLGRWPARGWYWDRRVPVQGGGGRQRNKLSDFRPSDCPTFHGVNGGLKLHKNGGENCTPLNELRCRFGSG